MIPDPLLLFDQWLGEAEASEPAVANAMALATANERGRPSCRIVLLKARHENGFIFYTDSRSRKGADLAANAQAALCFHWRTQQRQVRIEGSVEPVDDATADTYFSSRSYESRIGATVSHQSAPLSSRQALDTQFGRALAAADGAAIARPLYWRGYLVRADHMEFWSEGAHRLHDRHLFTLTAAGWMQGLLQP